ncbi:hypothetical protein [Alkalimarinus alittae]|uniref:Uncharacterized protein n=1 Tax=Alkalimarinus alittae TaxID=2961619 RepID=A0ABY6MX54_9ALTE|nr:hypothetical protein [Alkalimarinus alittae]UZE94382.1 hypothetical protein NKI27_09765 [Alkalimarinus alittae]
MNDQHKPITLSVSQETVEFFLEVMDEAPVHSTKLKALAEDSELRKIIIERKDQPEIDINIDEL